MALTLLLSAAASAGGHHRIYGVQDCAKPRVEPKRIVFACADAGLYANHFDWKHWGDRKARTNGVMHARICDPFCIGAPFRDYPVKLVARRIRTVTCNGRRLRMYTKIKLSFPAAKPPRVDEGSRPYECF